MKGSMKMSRQTAESSCSMRGCVSGDVDGSAVIGNRVTRARIEKALRFMAIIVSGTDGELYLPIFERLERELAAIDVKTDALQRARSMVASIPRSSPSTRRDA